MRASHLLSILRVCPATSGERERAREQQRKRRAELRGEKLSQLEASRLKLVPVPFSSLPRFGIVAGLS